MQPHEIATWSLAGAAAAVSLVSLVSWNSGRRLSGVLNLLGLTAAGWSSLVLAARADLDLSPTVLTGVLTLCALAAVSGGGSLTGSVFWLVDGASGRTPRPGGVRSAADVLRGGAWIGALERVAVFTALVSGWPEGIALTLALKGLGRYPELRNEEHSGIAERFLIGTFTSVLWACAWAGIALVVLG